MTTLPYSTSTLIAIAIVSLAIVIAVNGRIPNGNRVITFLFRCLRAMTAHLVMRKGIVWTTLVWTSLLAVAADTAVIFQGLHWWQSVQTITLFTVPPAIGWTLRQLYRKRQSRRFQLPKRKQ